MEFMTPVDKYMISGVHRIRIGSLARMRLW